MSFKVSFETGDGVGITNRLRDIVRSDSSGEEKAVSLSLVLVLGILKHKESHPTTRRLTTKESLSLIYRVHL